MFKTNRSWWMLPVLGWTLTAPAGCSQQCQKCKDPLTANDMYLDKMDESMHSRPEHFTDMADNAMLHDMTVADIHFIPHSVELSGTGAARLNRMAALLTTYGGTVRYETFNTDEKLVKGRLDNVREYLQTTGCEMARVDTKAMISGGRGIAANKAILIDVKGTAKDAKGGKTTTVGTPIQSGQGK